MVGPALGKVSQLPFRVFPVNRPVPDLFPSAVSSCGTPSFRKRTQVQTQSGREETQEKHLDLRPYLVQVLSRQQGNEPLRLAKFLRSARRSPPEGALDQLAIFLSLLRQQQGSAISAGSYRLSPNSCRQSCPGHGPGARDSGVYIQLGHLSATLRRGAFRP